MAFTVKSSASATSGFTAPTGRSQQNHLVYAANQGAYWAFYLSGTQVLNALYSTNNGTSWSTPTNSPYTLIDAHNGQGLNFGFGYGNISSTDVLHMISGYTGSHGFHSRFTLGTTWTNTSSETTIDAGTNSNSTNGAVTILSSAAKPFDAFNDNSGNCDAYIATNADAGSSWTGGFGTNQQLENGNSVDCESMGMASLGSGNMLWAGDNGSSGGHYTNLRYQTCTSGTWTTSQSNFLLASTVTATPSQSWGIVGRTTSDVHVVSLSDNASAFVHRRFNGSTWADSSGAPGSLTLATNSGISMVTDGTSVWAFAIDSSKNIQYNKWTTGGGWGGWTVLEATRTNTPSYVTACYNGSSNIMVAWTEVNGSNFDIIGSLLTLVAAPSPPQFYPIVSQEFPLMYAQQ